MHGETYKSVVKLTFAKGAALKGPARLFYSSLEGNVRRAIDIREGEKINESALKELIRGAVELNRRLKKGGSYPDPQRQSTGTDFRVAWKNTLAKIEA